MKKRKQKEKKVKREREKKRIREREEACLFMDLKSAPNNPILVKTSGVTHSLKLNAADSLIIKRERTFWQMQYYFVL